MSDSDDFTPSLEKFITEVWDASSKLLQTGAFKVEVKAEPKGFLIKGSINLGSTRWGIEFQFGYIFQRSILSAVNPYWPRMTDIEEYAVYVQSSRELNLPPLGAGWDKFREAVLVKSQPYISKAIKEQSQQET
jgi:hypothetical protein